MITHYQVLPVSAPHVLRIESHKKSRAAAPSAEAVNLDREDAERILRLAGLDYRLFPKVRLEAQDKFLIETAPNQSPSTSGRKDVTPANKKRARKPHYAHLLQMSNRLFFQAACCKPLKIIAASLDGNPVSARILYRWHSKDGGGKLVIEIEIADSGHEVILDMQRAESARVQRYIFTVAPPGQVNSETSIK